MLRGTSASTININDPNIPPFVLSAIEGLFKVFTSLLVIEQRHGNRPDGQANRLLLRQPFTEE
jgi:hypothetical protein